MILTQFFRADFGILTFTIKDFFSGLSDTDLGAGEAVDSSFDRAARPFTSGRAGVTPFDLRVLLPWSGADARCFCWEGNGSAGLETWLGLFGFLDKGLPPDLLDTVLESLRAFLVTCG